MQRHDVSGPDLRHMTTECTHRGSGARVMTQMRIRTGRAVGLSLGGVRSNPNPTGAIGHEHPCQSGFVLAVIAAAWLHAPASAQTSTLHGIVYTTGVPAIQQFHTNVEFASLSGLISHDPAANDGNAAGSLATPTGMFTLTSHACSGGGPGFAGQANGSADAAVNLDYKIV